MLLVSNKLNSPVSEIDEFECSVIFCVTEFAEQLCQLGLANIVCPAVPVLPAAHRVPAYVLHAPVPSDDGVL